MLVESACSRATEPAFISSCSTLTLLPEWRDAPGIGLLAPDLPGAGVAFQMGGIGRGHVQPRFVPSRP